MLPKKIRPPRDQKSDNTKEGKLCKILHKIDHQIDSPEIAKPSVTQVFSTKKHKNPKLNRTHAKELTNYFANTIPHY